MRMRLMLLGGGNALGQALIRLGAEEDIGFLAPRPPEKGWDPASLTLLLDEHRPDVVINLAYYFDWFQAESVSEQRLTQQERAVERLAELCQHHEMILVQPSSYRVFDGSRATAYSEKDEPVPLGTRGQALWRIEQSVRATCPQHVLRRFGWVLDESIDGALGRFLTRAEQPQELRLADDRRGNPTPVDDAARVILAVIKQLDCDAPLWG
ncbi:sugar nucleotide-binding protein, partial [Pseudomonas sp.]|uniref:sugar nucleotide-binding protein n=1 Tax=Pseudomonas sp. TaxID=306 RepID=UPI0028A0DF37